MALLCLLFDGATHAGSTDNPTLATFDGGEITLHESEVFARELPLGQRISFIHNANDWRQFVARELGKTIIFTTPALALGRHMDPAYLRGREYFLQEYLDFAMIRDNLLNQIDVSKEAQLREYKAHRQDFVITPTVALRYIRTRDADAASSAAVRLAAGEDFAQIERQVSEVSPRYLGRILGPFPDPKNRAGIPPPKEVLDAALQTPVGQTTGPLLVGTNYFIAKTEAKTTGGLATPDQASEILEFRIRNREGDRLRTKLMADLNRELGVQRDDDLLSRKSGAKPNDVLATVGATLITRQEFEDLNGRVRGPALQVAQHEPTRLAQFITPVLLAEGARARGYLTRPETKQALYYWDLQHLSSWYMDRAVADRIKQPTERDLRMRFAAKYQELKAHDPRTTPTFELHREQLLDSMLQERHPIELRLLTSEEFQKRNWRFYLKQPTQRMTAFEALVHVAAKVPKDARILEISEAGEHVASGHNWSVTAGRNQRWRITYATGGGSVSEIVSDGPGPLSDGSAEFTSCPLYVPIAPVWRFDTDALFRHAIDRGMGDFAAKYGSKLWLGSRVEIAYSEDDPTSPTDCLVTYTAQPADRAEQDGLIIKYSGSSGEVTQRRIGEPEEKCPTCPTPDLPASEIIRAAEGRTTGTSSSGTAVGTETSR